MSFASTGSSIQLIGTNAKCHSIGTRWAWIAACALDSTIQDAGAASPSPQTMHGGTSCAAVPRRRQTTTHTAPTSSANSSSCHAVTLTGPSCKKRLRTLTEILREHLRRHVHVPHRAVRQADAVRDGPGHVLPGVRRALPKQSHSLCEPERQRRSHTAQRRDTRPDGAAQPDERAVRVAPHKIRLGCRVAERDLTQDQNVVINSNPHMQRTMQAAATSGQHPRAFCRARGCNGRAKAPPAAAAARSRGTSTGPSCRAAARGPAAPTQTRTLPPAGRILPTRPAPQAAPPRRTACCSASRGQPPAPDRRAAGAAADG